MRAHGPYDFPWATKSLSEKNGPGESAWASMGVQNAVWRAPSPLAGEGRAQNSPSPLAGKAAHITLLPPLRGKAGMGGPGQAVAGCRAGKRSASRRSRCASRLAFGTLGQLFNSITEKRLEFIRYVGTHGALNLTPAGLLLH